jgi:hypothetical protein
MGIRQLPAQPYDTTRRRNPPISKSVVPNKSGRSVGPGSDCSPIRAVTADTTRTLAVGSKEPDSIRTLPESQRGMRVSVGLGFFGLM